MDRGALAAEMERDMSKETWQEQSRDNESWWEKEEEEEESMEKHYSHQTEAEFAALDAAFAAFANRLALKVGKGGTPFVRNAKRRGNERREKEDEPALARKGNDISRRNKGPV